MRNSALTRTGGAALRESNAMLHSCIEPFHRGQSEGCTERHRVKTNRLLSDLRATSFRLCDPILALLIEVT
jgi:hypothetical protein